jgi:hypothetical protein
LPITSGTVITTGSTFAGTGPAFSVSSATGVVTSSGVFTKLTYDTEDFDTNNNFASSRFTPTVAGYYQFNATALYSGGPGGGQLLSFYKNGSRWLDGPLLVQNTIGSSSYITFGGIIYLNGSTDYVELFGYQTAGTQTIGGGGATQKFTGCLVRSA